MKVLNYPLYECPNCEQASVEVRGNASMCHNCRVIRVWHSDGRKWHEPENAKEQRIFNLDFGPIE